MRWRFVFLLLAVLALSAPPALAQVQWGSWSPAAGSGGWSEAASTGGWTTVVVEPAGPAPIWDPPVVPAAPAAVAVPAPAAAPGNAAVPDPARELLADTQAARLAAGLPALREVPALDAVARRKALDLAGGAYFGHVSPVFGLTVNLIQDAGIPFTVWGENIAAAPTAAAGFAAWMGSPSHRANILNPAFDRVGVAAVPGPYGLLLVQEFLGG